MDGTPFHIEVDGEILSDKDKQSKKYLVVLYPEDNFPEQGSAYAKFITGQANTREYIINKITNEGDFELERSFVLVENIPFGLNDGCPSVIEFLRWIGKDYDDGFDIDKLLEDIDNNKEFDKLRNMFDADTPATYQRNQIEDMLSGKTGKELE